MSPWRGELEGGDLLLFSFDSVLGDSHHVFLELLSSDDKLKLPHFCLTIFVLMMSSSPGSTCPPGKYTKLYRFSPHAHDLLTYAGMIEAQQWS